MISFNPSKTGEPLKGEKSCPLMQLRPESVFSERMAREADRIESMNMSNKTLRFYLENTE
jgi:hypothetical protein